MYLPVYNSYSWYSTVGLPRMQNSIYTSSSCSYGGCTYVVTCTYVYKRVNDPSERTEALMNLNVVSIYVFYPLFQPVKLDEQSRLFFIKNGL